jgi:hypothetical protein
MESTHKKKAMSSEKASKVKTDGHTNEDDFAKLIPGSAVIKGTGKTDVQYKSFNFSLKKICKRIQMALYTQNSKNWLESSPSSQACKRCLEIYPKTFEEYKANKTYYKDLLREKMIQLKDHLSVLENLREYLSLIMFKNEEVNFLVMKDKEQQYIYYFEDVLNTLLENVEVFNSKALKAGDVPEQKVIIKCRNEKNVLSNLFEIEVRNSSDQHYAEMLCVCNRDKLFELLNSHLKEEKIVKNSIVLRGKAIDILYDELSIL